MIDKYNISKTSILQKLEIKEFLLNALDVLDVGIHIVDAQGRTIYYSKGLEIIEQQKSDYVLGKHISETYQLDDDSSILLKALKTGQSFINLPYTYKTTYGNTVNIVTNTYPIFINSRIAGAISTIEDVTQVKKLVEEKIKLQKALFSQNLQHNKNTTQYTFKDIIGTSESIVTTVDLAKRIAVNSSSVLIIGETGTGKELFAQGIHNFSTRAKHPFVAVNCSAIPETLLEGILFGTSKGAFTGAEEKPGLFEEAQNGTIFLDELNSMSLMLQSKLLRVLQTNKVRRVGSNSEIPLDVRIISAMNINPQEALNNNQLRSDFYYRIAVVSLFIPPLRQRLEDLPELCNHFIRLNNKRMGKKISGLHEDVVDFFNNYEWPGNIRELEHVIEHSMNVVDCYETTINIHQLPHYIEKQFNIIPTQNPYSTINLKETLLEIEKGIVTQELHRNKGNISKTAGKLGISRQHLQYRMKLLAITIPNLNTD
ncbi:MAG: sigma-54 interaction domain-containing protein [Bacillota bacterium]